MPSFVGHTLAGFCVARLFEARRRPSAWQTVLLANAADLDVLPGLAVRAPGDYHGRVSHSIAAAVGAGLLAGAAARARGGCFGPGFGRAVVLYGSHLLLDVFGKVPEDGLPLFWPFSAQRIGTNRPVFRTIYSRRGRFFTGLFTRRNLRSVAREVVLLLPLGLAVGAAAGRGRSVQRTG